MIASEFEFRHRFWFIAGIFNLAFLAYLVDPRNLGGEIVEWLHGGAVDFDQPAGRRELQLVFLAGAALVIVAALLRTWATAYLTSDVVHDSKLRQDEVVADGPFRFVRNPLYLGLFLMALGMTVFASRLGAAWLVVAAAVFGRRLIGLEERQLLAAGGESYRAYLARVPRILPALSPRLPASGRAPRWRQAIVGELFIWAFAAASLALAIFLDGRAFGLTCFAGMAIYLLGRRFAR